MVEQAVILAELPAPAGSGEAGDPCRELLGLGLLQRLVLVLAHGGIGRILVLVGEEGKSLNDLASGAGVWRRSGADVRLAVSGKAELPLPEAPFLLLAPTAVFTPALVGWLRTLPAEKNLLLTSGEEEPRSGPGFSGLAVCRAEVFPCLLALAAGRERAEGLDSLLAGSETLPVHGRGWVLVNSESTARRARRLLRSSLGKPSDGFFSRHLNRHISWPISRLLIRLRVSPNQVTMANLVLGLLSGWLIGRGGYGNTLAAGLLFQFVSIFDGCDGEIARLTFRFSALGAKLDNLCDFVTLAVFFLNLPIGLYAAGGNISYLVLGAAMVLVVAVFYLLLLARIKLSGHRGNIAEVARQVQDKGKGGRPLGWMERLGARLGFIYRKEFISLGIMTLCLIDRAALILWGVFISASLGLGYELYHIGQLIRQKRNS